MMPTTDMAPADVDRLVAALRSGGQLPFDLTRHEANRLLDLLRSGGAVPQARVIAALWVTGDLSAPAVAL